MNNTKKIIYFFTVSSLIIVGFYLGYKKLLPLLKEEKVYYIPEIEIFIKTSMPLMDKYGYVFICQDSASLSSKQIDYFKIHKTDITSIDLIVDPKKKEQLFLNDRFGFATFYPKEYKVDNIDFRDTTFFSREDTIGLIRYMPKPAYLSIEIENYLKSVFVKNISSKYFSKIRPIKE